MDLGTLEIRPVHILSLIITLGSLIYLWREFSKANATYGEDKSKASRLAAEIQSQPFQPVKKQGYVPLQEKPGRHYEFTLQIGQLSFQFFAAFRAKSPTGDRTSRIDVKITKKRT